MPSADSKSPGCVILLIDESSAMESPVVDEQEVGFPQMPKPKSAVIATAVNSLLGRLGSGPDFDIAVVGYRTDSDGNAAVGARWGGALAGSEFVATSRLADNVAVVETRQRKVHDPASLMGYREEPVQFPVWYVAATGNRAPQVAAFQYCRELLGKWMSAAGEGPGTPLIIHVSASGSGDGNPLQVIQDLWKTPVGNVAPLVYQVQLSVSKSVPTTQFTSNRTFLPSGPMRDLFDRSSSLASSAIDALKESKIAVTPGARGMVGNAKMPDVVRALSLVTAHVKHWGPRAAATVPNSQPPAPAKPAESATAVPGINSQPPVDLTSGQKKSTLLALVLDRSVQDPFAADAQNSCSRLTQRLNEILGELAKAASGEIDVAVVSYGIDGTGAPDVRMSFEGPLTGRTFVSDADLAGNPLRVDESTEQVPDGVGGVMTIPSKNPVFFELEPTASCSCVTAFDAVRSLLGDWCSQHPQNSVPPVVLHLTRGRSEAAEIADAASKISAVQTAAGSVALYHLVATENPHPSVAYPSADDELQTAELKALWSISSPLLGAKELEVLKPNRVAADSRGLVINGKFDLLLQSIQQVLKM